MTTNGATGGQRKIRVAVLFGGESEEHDVSLRSAQTVLNSLDPVRFESVEIGITRDGRWMTQGDPMARLTAASPLFALHESNPVGETNVAPEHDQAHFLPADIASAIDVVFPVLHGPRGEDGTVQGLLELAGIPYVGSGVLGSAVGMDKIITKTILAQHGIRQAPWLLINRQDWLKDPSAISTAIGDTLGYPCFIKPANMGSSVGVTKVHSPVQLDRAVEAAALLDRRIIAERGIDARELEISVLGNNDPIASCLGEVVPHNEFYDYAAKYVDDTSELLIPAPVAESVQHEAQQMAVAAFRALDLAGLARVDFLLDRGTNELYLSEVNTLPGFTSISMYPMLWEASGLSNSELVERLIELAFERHAENRGAGSMGERARSTSAQGG